MYTVNFTPGPSQLYFTLPDHVKFAFKSGVPSLSHRSKEFESIFKSTTDNIRQLLGVPSDWHIFFTGSATEIWERVLENLVDQYSFHYVNGSFSQRFYEIALQLKKDASLLKVQAGLGFQGTASVPDQAELVAVTHNETSTGVTTPLDFIHQLSGHAPHALVAVDAVSSLPYPQFDYARVDSVFFSVQKGFGLPAGLGVWMVNQKCLDRAEALQKKGLSIGSYHNLPSLHAHGLKSQTPETPNVLAIYLLGKVTEDMLTRGIHQIRKETEYKAAILYQLLENHSLLQPFVQDKNIRSKTVIVANCGEHTEKVRSVLQQSGLYPGDGYGSAKKEQLRFANFPTHSKEQFECLVDILEKIK